MSLLPDVPYETGFPPLPPGSLTSHELDYESDCSQQDIDAGDVATTESRPRREKGNYKPAQVILDNTTTRRKRAQIEANTAALAAQKESMAREAKAQIMNITQKVAHLEDKLQAENAIYEQHAIRPDRQLAAPPAQMLEERKSMVIIIIFFS